MTFDKELNKKSLGELYYGKENLMGYRVKEPWEIRRSKKEKVEMEKNKGEEVPMVNKEYGSAFLSTIHDKKLLKKTKEVIEFYGLNIHDNERCQEAMQEARRILKEKENKKKTRYHVDLSESMGKDFSDLAARMGLTLNAVVKLFLMDDWQKLNVSGFDYIYLGIADRPKAPGEIPF